MKALLRRAQKRAGVTVRISAVIAVLASPLAVSSAASAAGTLTSPTWSVMDPRTNIQGNRYDYGFTTATTGTVARVTATVPAGTTGSNRYFASNGVVGNYASTPDSTNNSITGDLDVRVKVALDDYNRGIVQMFAAKRNNTDFSWSLGFSAGNQLELSTTSAGNNPSFNAATGTPKPANGSAIWYRATRSSSSGAITFYSSQDGTSWSNFGTASTGASGIYDSGAPIEIGSYGIGSQTALFGKIYYEDLRGSISGTTTSTSSCSQSGVVNCFDPSNDSVGGTTWPSASSLGETWTVNRTGTNSPADIASDLSIMTVSGITAGGTAQVREIDATAVYRLPTPASITSGTAVKLGLAGMTNTYTAGSPTSTITTLDNSGASIDSASTNAVAFTAPTINTWSAAPTVLQTATAATTVDLMPSAIGTSSGKLLLTDTYANTANAVDTSNGLETRVIGNGVFSPASGATALTTSLSGPSGIVRDSSGNTYVAQQYGSWITKVSGTTASNIVTSGIQSVNGMAIDSSDNIYLADSGRQVIEKMTTGGTVSVVAGTSGTSGSTLGSNATSSYLNNPRDVAVTPDGTTLYIADTNNNRILKVIISTGAISLFAGGGGSTAEGVAPTSSTLTLPAGVAADASNNVFISDTGANKVRKVTGSAINTVAGTGTAGYSGDSGAGTSAMINKPGQVRVDSSGTVFFVDSVNQRIRSLSGTTVTTFAGTGQSSWTGDGGNVKNAHFYQPSQSRSDSKGNLFVADTGNAAIRKIDQFGTVTTVAGSGPFQVGFGGDGGPATSAQLNTPQDVIPDNANNLYIADSYNNRIRVVNSAGVISTLASGAQFFQLAFSPDFTTLYATSGCSVVTINKTTGALTTIAGNGSCGTSSGDFGPATSAITPYTRGLVVDGNGNIYFSEFFTHKVRKIDSAGIITSYGSNGSSFTEGGTNASQNGQNANRLAIDSAGNIYQQATNRVTRLGVNGTANGVAGNNTSGNSGDGGAATAAAFQEIIGIGFNLGNMYISDDQTQTIRVVANQAAVAPLVNNDAMNVPMNSPRTWPILSNDWSRSNEMDPSSVVVKTQPANGTVSIENPTTEDTTLQARFTPTTGFTGSDSFTYSACDTTRVQCRTATVAVTVSSNQVVAIGGAVLEGTALNFAASARRAFSYNNYIFYSDDTLRTLRRYDIYSKQSVVVAGNEANSLVDGVGTSSSFVTPAGVTATPDGTLTIADKFGGAIRRLALDGTLSTLSALSSPEAVTFGKQGTLYATSGNTIKQWNGTAWVGYAGTGTTGGSGNGGAAAAATLNAPTSLLTASNGDIYVSDQTDCTIRKINTAGIISAVAGTSGTCSYTGDGGQATSATMQYQLGIAFDGAGNLLVAENYAQAVRRISPAGVITTLNITGLPSSIKAIDFVPGKSTDFIVFDSRNFKMYSVSTGLAATLLAGNGTSSYGTDGTIALNSDFKSGGDSTTAVDSLGNIYVHRAANPNVIRRIAAGTNVVSTVATAGGSTKGMTVDASNNLVYADIYSCRVYKYSGGTTTTIAGNGSCTSSGNNGQAISAGIANPWGLAFDKAGNLYVSETNGNAVRKITPGGVITTVAGTGSSGLSGDGGLATSAQLNNATGIAIDRSGNLLSGGTGNHRIRLVDANGFISTFAGTTSGSSGNGGRATSASMTSPAAIAVDASNNVFISDNYSVVRRVDGSSGIITTVAGSTNCGAALPAGSTASSAVFCNILGLAFDLAGNLIVSDSLPRLWQVTAVGSTASNALPSATWRVSPSATGHANLRESFSFTPNASVTASKLSFLMPTSFAVSGTSLLESYGLTGATMSTSGTTLNVSFPSQVLAAGVPVFLSLENVTNGGANGAWTTCTTLYDSAGTTAIGWATSNIVNITASGAPAVGAAGYSGILKRSLSTTQSALGTVAVSPVGVADTTAAFTLTNSGSINANSTNLKTTAIAGFTPITASSSTSIATGSFAVNRWGLQVVSSTGTAAGATGTGLYSGLATTPTAVATGTGASNVLTVTARAKIDYLQPAATYRSTLAWSYSGGS